MDLVSLEEIRQVKYRYLRCVDLKLWDQLADTFTPDATVDYGTMVYGQPLKLASQGRRPAHRYTLADFGLTGGEVDERFAAIGGYEPSKR
jgi:SnoaL-like domain